MTTRVRSSRGIRQANLAAGLAGIPTGQHRSRAELAQVLGVTRATASAIVGELCALGLVEELEPTGSATAGRPATPVARRARGAVGIGVEVDLTTLRVCTTDNAGNTSVAVTDIPAATTRRPGDLARELAKAIKAEQRLWRRRKVPVAGVVVAVPGLVHERRNDVLLAPTLGWRDIPLAHLLAIDGVGGPSDTTIEPPRVANEADVGAHAERHLGLVPLPDSVLYLSAGNGVGAALVLHGIPFSGAHGFGGEIGHIVVDPLGAPCGCGRRGCLETVVGASALRRLARLDRWPGADWPDELLRRANEGDPAASAALATSAAHLSTALSIATDLFDPDVVVLGGHLQPLAEFLAPIIEHRLAERSLAAGWAAYPVRAATLGPDAAALGAAHLALQPIRDNPSILRSFVRPFTPR